MTYIIGTKCDICGEIRTEEYTGQEHKLPDGWATITVHYTHLEDGPSHQQRHICETCARGLESGESVEGYKARMAKEHIIKIMEDAAPMPLYIPEEVPL